MRFQLNIGVGDLSIYKNFMPLEIIPAYIFVGENNNVMLGKKAYRARGLYPESIYSLNNIISEQNHEMLEIFITAIDEYIKREYCTENYEIIFSIYPNEMLLNILRKIVKGNINNVSLSNEFYVMKNGTSELFIDSKSNKTIIGDQMLVSYFNNVIADNLTSLVLKTYKRLSATYFHKIKEIIFKDIESYKDKLLVDGETVLFIKIVDEDLNIHKIFCAAKREDIFEEKLIKLFEGINKGNEASIKENFVYNLCNKYFKVSLISPFSHGKSTILNSIVGDSLLNMDIRAETAVITKISSSLINRVFIKYSESHIKAFNYNNVDELKDIISIHTSVRSGQSLPEEVHILYKLSNMQGVTLIDSPGLFSHHKDHNSIAEKALEISDLVLFVINPGKTGEKNFTEKMKLYIEYIRKNNKQFAFILSKYDIYEQDKSEVLDEFNKVLEMLDVKENDIFFVSGYFALMGKLLRENKIDIDKVRKTKDIYVIQEDDFITGRGIMQEHYENLIKFSNIEVLENYIAERGGSIADKKSYMVNR